MKQLPASTLMETMLSLALITLAFGAGLLVWANLVHYQSPGQRLKALQPTAWNATALDDAGLIIETAETPSANNPNLFLEIKQVVRTDGQLVYEQKQWIYRAAQTP